MQATRSRRAARQERLPSLWWGLVALLAMPASIAALLYAAAWYWQATAPREVQVPNVVGLDEQAAVAILRERDLRPRVPLRRYDEKHAEGKVLEVTPPVNRTVKQGRSVALTVSKGSRWTKVPNLGEMSVEQARNLLVKSQLTLAKLVEEYNETVPEGYTIRQFPAPGRRVERGTAVELTVSKGVRLPEELAPAPRTTKYAQVEVQVPPGEFRREVKITVDDDGGEREVYREWRDPGTTFTTTVEGTGSVTVRIYIDDDLVEEKTL